MPIEFNWDMSQAPKDRPILAWCKQPVDDNDPPSCGCYASTAPPGSRRLCLYHAHLEGLGSIANGPHVIEWGGSFEDSWEDGGGYLPDWWFRFDSEFEAVAYPIAWADIPTEIAPF